MNEMYAKRKEEPKKTDQPHNSFLSCYSLSTLLQSMQKQNPQVSLLILHLKYLSSKEIKKFQHTQKIIVAPSIQSDLLSHFVTNMVDLIYSRSNSSIFLTLIFCCFTLCSRLSIFRSSATICVEVSKNMHVFNHKKNVSENF